MADPPWATKNWPNPTWVKNLWSYFSNQNLQIGLPCRPYPQCLSETQGDNMSLRDDQRGECLCLAECQLNPREKRKVVWASFPLPIPFTQKEWVFMAPPPTLSPKEWVLLVCRRPAQTQETCKPVWPSFPLPIFPSHSAQLRIQWSCRRPVSFFIIKGSKGYLHHICWWILEFELRTLVIIEPSLIDQRLTVNYLSLAKERHLTNGETAPRQALPLNALTILKVQHILKVNYKKQSSPWDDSHKKGSSSITLREKLEDKASITGWNL